MRWPWSKPPVIEVVEKRAACPGCKVVGVYYHVDDHGSPTIVRRCISNSCRVQSYDGEKVAAATGAPP